MRERAGDLWLQHELGEWIVVPTNGIVKGTGELVMGAGTALTARLLHPDLPRILGLGVIKSGSHVHCVSACKIISFPTKRHWKSSSKLGLIRKSAAVLWKLYKADPDLLGHKVYLPHVGCGEGHLTWEVVGNVLHEILDDRFIALDYRRPRK